ncbi:aKG-HExxH-type peptide beta-hydroxylase [Streptomyces paludis]|uniref:HEXXH motif domain-containing protein n=1 Tax=Streptomyces paludis TaxID=2282738 RepID=A0A345HU49_9ACTN|nr:HEXXH motif-containing putative peptide modification protein [Streptomyces paludis]AXG80223.1 HEXXH motif domain-containing protein [Streptomyces paludis]
MNSAVPEAVLRELGRTEGGTDALRLLVRDQHTRRLVLLRAVLDAAADAPASVCPPALRDRLGEDWALLEAAERADRDAVRAVLLYPLAGPWAERTLHGLTAEPPAPATATAPAPTPGLDRDLGHFGALTAAAAVRARLPFAVRLTARGGLLPLPTLGALRTGPGPYAPAEPVDVALKDGRVTLRPESGPPVIVTADTHGARSADPRWLPLLTLPAIRPGAAPVPLDDLDPYRTVGGGPQRYGLSVAGPDPRARADWAGLWSRTAPLLGAGGPHRTAETAALLRCLVPLAPPPGVDPADRGRAQCSGTRRDAFGAVLSSRPATPEHLATTLVHELQHAKLDALATLVPLHHEDPAPRHFAPWRTDPRPFDGLLQGAYSHLALAGHWQRLALGAERLPRRELAWSEHARCREQVGAVLPVLAGSGALTREGRVLVNEMITVYHRLADHPPPAGHLARATAYVRTARVIWRQRNGT